MDAVLEIFDNGLEACYHPELKAGKHKAIFLTYGKAPDTDKPALEIFDGGIGMSGMDSSSGGIAAWAALVSLCSTCTSSSSSFSSSSSSSSSWSSSCWSGNHHRSQRCACVISRSLHLLMSLCQHLRCDILCVVLAAGPAHLRQCCFCCVTMQETAPCKVSSSATIRQPVLPLCSSTCNLLCAGLLGP